MNRKYWAVVFGGAAFALTFWVVAHSENRVPLLLDPYDLEPEDVA